MLEVGSGLFLIPPLPVPEGIRTHPACFHNYYLCVCLPVIFSNLLSWLYLPKHEQMCHLKLSDSDRIKQLLRMNK